MADTSPLAGLLNRAGRVFYMADQLGEKFLQDFKSREVLDRINTDNWFRRKSSFVEFWAAGLELRDPVQDPPDGFAPVAQVLLEAARVAEQIREVMKTGEGVARASYLEYWPKLKSVADAGRRAIDEVKKAQRPADPFAFVDQPALGKDAGIDTTPANPKPPTGVIEEALKGIDAAEPAEMKTEPTYDPCDREPRTYAELVRWMVYWADFRNPHRTGLRSPTIAQSPDHHYLESYCKDMFGMFDLEALDKLRTRYIVQTPKTVEQIDTTTLRELADHVRGPRRQAAEAEQPLAGKPNSDTSIALVRVFTNGLADDRIEKATRLLADDALTANEKLTKIDTLIPFPATASARRLGEMLGVSKQAVLKTDWWIQNRKGEKENEIGRRRTGHKKRAAGIEPPHTNDDDD